MATNNRRQRRRRRHRYNRLLDRVNPLETMPETETFERFRFRPDTIMYIVDLLNPYLTRPTGRSNVLSPLLKVLVTLRFLATGGFYSLVSDTFSFISTVSVCRAVKDVCRQLCQISRFVKIPTGDAAESMKTQFYLIAAFPNVLGCVDGTYIRIQCPEENEAEFFYRKGIHKGLLFGDSGYPCKPYLMTPFFLPSNPAEEKYNKSIAKTRVIIEQTFGILKRRFACLHNRILPEKACDITLGCVVLNNIGIERNDILDNDEVYINVVDVDFNVGDDWTGSINRQYISFFSR